MKIDPKTSAAEQTPKALEVESAAPAKLEIRSGVNAGFYTLSGQKRKQSIR